MTLSSSWFADKQKGHSEQAQESKKTTRCERWSVGCRPARRASRLCHSRTPTECLYLHGPQLPLHCRHRPSRRTRHVTQPPCQPGCGNTRYPLTCPAPCHINLKSTCPSDNHCCRKIIIYGWNFKTDLDPWIRGSKYTAYNCFITKPSKFINKIYIQSCFTHNILSPEFPSSNNLARQSFLTGR